MIIVVLPVYNEEKNIKRVIFDIENVLTGQLYKIIIVNDGSTDNTLSLIKAYKKNTIEIVSYTINGNIGTAFSNGIQSALLGARPDDLIVIMESDGTSDPELLLQFIEKSTHNQNDVCIASRYAWGGTYVHFPFQRYVISKIANYSLRKLFPIPNVYDYTIFYRSYRASILKKACLLYSRYGLIRGAGFVANAELLIKLSFLGARVIEIPFVYDYGNKRSQSKMTVMKTVFEYILMVTHLRRIQSSRWYRDTRILTKSSS